MSEPPALDVSKKPPSREPKYFFLGFIAGCIVSAIAWLGYGRTVDSDMGMGKLSVLLWVIPIVKVIAAGALMVLRTYYNVGIGVIASIPVGLFMLLAVC